LATYSTLPAAFVRVSFVPLQAAFDQKTKSSRPEYWAADGVHPTPAGYAAMRTVAKAAIRT